ncbi:transcription factor Ken-like isoform X1 [Onthophagus taurus]|uniref:transcription factor Ken-like isoform X1 n=1 Tax=Onthophagus taurus TaxID=166361 RepID=UPI0039BE71B8
MKLASILILFFVVCVVSGASHQHHKKKHHSSNKKHHLKRDGDNLSQSCTVCENCNPGDTITYEIPECNDSGDIGTGGDDGGEADGDDVDQEGEETRGINESKRDSRNCCQCERKDESTPVSNQIPESDPTPSNESKRHSLKKHHHTKKHQTKNHH